MEIIPAIDLRGGRCVRLMQGDYQRETVYGDDPVSFARLWADEGARRLHVVDLDGARLGEPNPDNLAVLRDILAVVDIPVQLGGGIRSLQTALKLLEMGVDRVVVGTRIARDERAAAEFFEALGDRVVAGVDARNGRVAVSGWRDTTHEDAAAFATRMADLGARRIIFTDVSLDGTQQGPNLDALARVAAAAKIPVIASGGVGHVAHVAMLARQAPPNVEGVIIGRALYTGALSLKEAIEAARTVRRE